MDKQGEQQMIHILFNEQTEDFIFLSPKDFRHYNDFDSSYIYIGQL